MRSCTPPAATSDCRKARWATPRSGTCNIGAGRVVKQELVRIGDAVVDGSIAEAPAFISLVDALKKTGGTCHLIGLCLPGGVHSHQDHAAALAGHLHRAGVKSVVHAITDGRDTPPQSAAEYLKRFQAALPDGVPVATVIGRYFAMDRDKRWDRVALAYGAMVEAEGARRRYARGRGRGRLRRREIR